MLLSLPKPGDALRSLLKKRQALLRQLSRVNRRIDGNRARLELLQKQIEMLSGGASQAA